MLSKGPLVSGTQNGGSNTLSLGLPMALYSYSAVLFGV